MEQLLKNFGNLLGMPTLHVPAGKLLRLEIEDLGDLDLFYEEGRLLMRLTRSTTILNKELIFKLLDSSHYRLLFPQPLLPWFQPPDRIGLGFLFSERQATPDQLYQSLEILTKAFKRVCL